MTFKRLPNENILTNLTQHLSTKKKQNEMLQIMQDYNILRVEQYLIPYCDKTVNEQRRISTVLTMIKICQLIRAGHFDKKKVEQLYLKINEIIFIDKEKHNTKIFLNAIKTLKENYDTYFAENGYKKHYDNN